MENVHAMPLPAHLVSYEETDGGYLKAILVTFFIGLIIGGSILIIITSIIRIRLINTKEKELAKAASVNPREECVLADSLDLARSCTYIVLRDDGGHGSGISLGNGLILTNKHVVEGAQTFVTRVAGAEKPTTLVGTSADYDIALLRVDTPIAQCRFYDASKLNPAEELYAVGWPKEKEQVDPAITKGIFSRMNTQTDNITYVQTDAAINPGNSGGSLVNQCGVVGINTAKFSWFNQETPTEGLSLAMPIQLALEIVKTIRQ